MRSRSGPELAGRCAACRLRREQCLCAEVRPVPTRVELVVVRHALEALKSTNTARLAALVLPGLRVVEYGGVEAPILPESLTNRPAWLLDAASVPATPPGPPPERLIVLDGSWSQVRGMRARLRPLHRLPVLTIASPPAAPARARAAPRPEQLSTIEAIAGALDVLEPGEAGPALRALYGVFVERVLATRGRRWGGSAASGARNE